jgi:sec-independent protein translocase protein TatB
VFGVSFGEALLLMVVAVVVIGPRNMPQMLQSLGRTIGKLRRMATDVRAQSGIDDILKSEGIEREVRELHKLATGRLLDMNLDYADEATGAKPAAARPVVPPRSREFPTGGVDADDVLPDDAYAPFSPQPPQLVAAAGVVPRGKGGYLPDDDEPEPAANAPPPAARERRAEG